MKQKTEKLEKGITLIALVITIIVLLILAGISVAMLTGDNGILKKATEAKEENSKSEIEERLELAVLASKANEENKINKQDLKEELKKQGFKEENIEEIKADDSYKVKENDYVYIIKISDGTIKEAGRIIFDNSRVQLTKGESTTLNIIKRNETDEILWESKNPSLVAVDDNGKVTAIGESGTVTIIATVKGTNYSTSCEIEVVKNISKLEISIDGIIKKGETKKLTVITDIDSNAEKIKFSSSDNSIATVSDDGKIMAISEGDVVITATGTKSGITGKCNITIYEKIDYLYNKGQEIVAINGIYADQPYSSYSKESDHIYFALSEPRSNCSSSIGVGWKTDMTNYKSIIVELEDIYSDNNDMDYVCSVYKSGNRIKNKYIRSNKSNLGKKIIKLDISDVDGGDQVAFHITSSHSDDFFASNWGTANEVTGNVKVNLISVYLAK